MAEVTNLQENLENIQEKAQDSVDSSQGTQEVSESTNQVDGAAASESSEQSQSTNNTQEQSTQTSESQNPSEQGNQENAPSEGIDSEISESESQSEQDNQNPSTSTSDGGAQEPSTPKDESTEQENTESKPKDELDSESQSEGGAQEQEQEKPLPPLENLSDEEKEQIPSFSTPDLNQKPAQNERLEAFYKEFEAQIQENQGLVASAHYSLLGIAELLKVSQEVWEFYANQSKLLENANQIYTELNTAFEPTLSYVNNSLITLGQTHKSAFSLYTQSENMLDEASKLSAKIQGEVEICKQNLAEMKDLELKIDYIKELQKSFSTLLKEGNNIKEQIKALVPNILAELQGALLTDKERFETELRDKKDEALTLFSEKTNTLLEHIKEFDIDYLEKKTYTDDALEKITEFLATLSSDKEQTYQTHNANLSELESKKNEYKNELENDKTAHRTELEQTKTEAKAELESDRNTYRAELETDRTTYKNELATDRTAHKNELATDKETHKNSLETYKNEKIAQITTTTNERKAELENFKLEKRSELEKLSDMQKKEIQVASESFIQNINAFALAEVLELKQKFAQIQLNTQSLGANYQSLSFTSSQTFNLPLNTREFFVFLRGGTGASNGTTAGAITSFGAYLSANGGSGNELGAGQRGETKAGFVTIPDNVAQIAISLGAGGLCVVSYARNNINALSFDTAFVTDDLALAFGAQRSANGAVLKQEWINVNIQSFAQANYYRNILGIERFIVFERINAQNFQHLRDDKGGSFASLSQLRFYLAKKSLESSQNIAQLIATKERELQAALGN